MEIILTIAYSGLFVFLIGRCSFFKVNGVNKKLIILGFLTKLIAGISLGLIYTYYYTDRLTADTFKFFDDSKVLYDSFFTHPADFFRMITGIGSGSEDLKVYYNTMKNWYDIYSPFNDNRTMIRFNALIRFISFGYYYVHVAFICFLSLTGLIAFVKVIEKELPDLSVETFLILLLTPSVLFWGSGLLKDSLVFFSFGMAFYLFSKSMNQRSNSYTYITLYLIAMCLLMISKFQVFLLSVPLFISWFLCKRFKWHEAITFISSMVTFVIAIILIGILNPSISLPALLASKQASFLELASISNAGSMISISKLEPNFYSIIINAPIGFFTALSRPFITDTGTALTLVAGIENTIVLIFGIWCLFHVKYTNISGKILLWFFICYTISSYILIGIITPVLGAIVRYKAQVLPFLIIVFVIVSYNGQNSMIKRLYLKIIPDKWK